MYVCIHAHTHMWMWALNTHTQAHTWCYIVFVCHAYLTLWIQTWEKKRNPHFLSNKYILETTLIKSSQNAYFKFHDSKKSACCVCHCIYNACQSFWHSEAVNKYFFKITHWQKGCRQLSSPVLYCTMHWIKERVGIYMSFTSTVFSVFALPYRFQQWHFKGRRRTVFSSV